MDLQPTISEVSQEIDSCYSSENIESIGKIKDEADITTSFGLTSTIKPKVHRTSKFIKKKKNAPIYRKAPQAPKRFKPAYICFSMANHTKIKKELGPNARVGNISKRISQVWHSLLPNERARWDKEAEEDKKRYEAEKAEYTGPWKILAKPSKVDVNAPKRPMSSFLYYAQKYRQIIKTQNPQLCNTEVSKLLGVMWKNAPKEEKQKYIEHEEVKRAIYKSAILEWHKKQEEVSLIPEHHQEHALDNSGRDPFPYSHQNNNSVERNEYLEQHLQQHNNMQTYYEHPPATHSIIPPQMSSQIYSQPPPHPGYNNDHYRHTYQDYPIHINGNPSNNTQQDYYTQNCEVQNQNYSVHHSSAPNQGYFAHNSGDQPQPWLVHDSGPQRYYSESQNRSQGDKGIFNSETQQYFGDSNNV